MRTRPVIHGGLGLVLAVGGAGCWTTELPDLPDTPLAFDPAVGGAPEGWWIQSWPMGELSCPDGRVPRFWLLYPEAPAGPMPTAVVYHPGAFDYVRAPDPAAPLAGETWRAPSRLSTDFATDAVFDLLGMGTGAGNGALATALANAGHAVLLPSNCWGDLWAGNLEGRRNDEVTEGFLRRGYEAAAFGWRMASDEAWAPINRVALPVPLDLSDVTLIGIGSGGRAIGELLAAEEVPRAIVLDSSPDDLQPWYAGAGGPFADEAAGLDRIFADPADAALGSLANAPALPDRAAYVFSRLDPALPLEMHDRARARIASLPDGWAWDHGRSGHALLPNDPDLAAEIVTWLTAPEG